MNVSALYYDYRDKSGEQNNNINSFVAAGLLYIIGNYLSNWSSYFVLTLCCRNNHICNFYNDLLQKMFAEWNEWPLQVVIVQSTDDEKVLGKRQYNMILTDSYQAFLETELHTYTADYNTNEYYYIFLQIRDHLAKVDMQKILEYCWQHYLINCIVQLQNAKGNFLIYTYFPFTEKYCGRVEAVLVNEYNGTSLIHEVLFPNKLKNFYGCPLRAALWHVPPNVHLSKDSNNVTYISGGFEGKLLLELAKNLNFSLDIMVPPNDTKRGMIMKNGTLTGALKLLQERRADLSLGSFQQTKKRGLVATSTINYFETVWVVVTLNEAYLLNSLETLLFPFSISTWYLLILACACAMGLAAFLTIRRNLLKNVDHVTLDIISMLLGFPAYYCPMSNTGRILNASWMIFSLLLRTLYQALLFYLTTTQVTRNLPQTLEDLVEQNYSVVTEPGTFNSIKTLSLFNNTHFITLNTADDTLPLVYLEKIELSQARHTVVIMPLTFQHYYTATQHKADVFHLLPKSIMNLKFGIFLSKHSFLTEQLDKLLILIETSAIMNAWYQQEIDMNYVKNEHIQMNHPLDLEQLKVAFQLLILNLLIAVLIFAIELMCKRINRKNFFKKIRNFVNRCIDIFKIA